MEAVEKGWRMEMPNTTKKKPSSSHTNSHRSSSSSRDQTPKTLFDVLIGSGEAIGVSIQKHRGGLARVVR